VTSGANVPKGTDRIAPARGSRERPATGRPTLVPEAYLAAMAIEHGCEWITTDRGFARFPGLKWRSPLDPTA
jgi:predicted nucleic acid-binding protein